MCPSGSDMVACCAIASRTSTLMGRYIAGLGRADGESVRTASACTTNACPHCGLVQRRSALRSVGVMRKLVRTPVSAPQWGHGNAADAGAHRRVLRVGFMPGTPRARLAQRALCPTGVAARQCKGLAWPMEWLSATPLRAPRTCDRTQVPGIGKAQRAPRERLPPPCGKRRTVGSAGS